MSVWKVAWRVIDTLLGIAIRADEINERRKERLRREQLGEALGRADARRERARANTVILPRPAPSTSPPAAAGGGTPTAPTRPGRGR